MESLPKWLITRMNIWNVSQQLGGDRGINVERTVGTNCHNSAIWGKDDARWLISLALPFAGNY